MFRQKAAAAIIREAAAMRETLGPLVGSRTPSLRDVCPVPRERVRPVVLLPLDPLSLAIDRFHSPLQYIKVTLKCCLRCDRKLGAGRLPRTHQTG